MSVQEVVAFVVAIGSMPAILKLIDWAKATKSGRAHAERERNRNALGRLVEAEDEAEFQTEWRRIISEHASHVRRIAIEWGVPENKLPQWPKPPTRAKAQ